MPRFVRLAGLGLLLATAIIALPIAHRDLNQRFTNVDLLAQQLAGEASPQDFIIVTPWYCGISFDRYFKGATPWQTLPPLADHSRHRYDLFREKARTPNALQPVFDQITATLQSGHCIWVVGTMKLPKPGHSAADDLGARLPDLSAESDIPYNFAWASQAAWFLAGHSLHFERAYSATNLPINSNENLQMLSASGWKTNQP